MTTRRRRGVVANAPTELQRSSSSIAPCPVGIGHLCPALFVSFLRPFLGSSWVRVLMSWRETERATRHPALHASTSRGHATDRPPSVVVVSHGTTCGADPGTCGGAGGFCNRCPRPSVSMAIDGLKGVRGAPMILVALHTELFGWSNVSSGRPSKSRPVSTGHGDGQASPATWNMLLGSSFRSCRVRSGSSDVYKR